MLSHACGLSLVSMLPLIFGTPSSPEVCFRALASGAITLENVNHFESRPFQICKLRVRSHNTQLAHLLMSLLLGLHE